MARFLCSKCRHVFDRENAATSEKPSQCPACGSPDISEAPAWAPLGSGLNIFDSNEWEYECKQCKKAFKLPIPKSPSEEKGRRCPACNSDHLHLLTNTIGLPLHCG